MGRKFSTKGTKDHEGNEGVCRPDRGGGARVRLREASWSIGDQGREGDCVRMIGGVERSNGHVAGVSSVHVQANQYPLGCKLFGG